MEKSTVIFSLLLVAAFLFAQCTSSKCTYKPKAAKISNYWIKKRWLRRWKSLWLFVPFSWQLPCFLCNARAAAVITNQPRPNKTRSGWRSA